MKYSIHALRAGALCFVAGALGLTACGAESEESVDTTTQAVSVHLKGGRNAEPSFIDGGFFLRSSGAVSGLGFGNVLVSLTAQANTTSTCTNQGGNQAPGHNPAPITVAGTQAIPATEVKNGNASFNVRTLDPVVSIPGAPDCPNGNWSEDLTDLQFTSATIEIEQGGVVVLTIFCSFSPPTSNGSVPAGNVTCTSS
jgi:hypothetical protein